MSQVVYTNIVPNTTSGNQLAQILNDFSAALMSGLIGSARPAALQAGGTWIDNSDEASPDYIWSVKLYTGTTDVVLYKVNILTNSIGISGSDNMFDVTRRSDDTVGALLQLVKERIANQGQVKLGDTIAEIQFLGTDDTGASPIVARIRSVALEDEISAEHGANMIFEVTTAGQAVLTEVFRVMNGFLGIGTTSPIATVHAKGITGMRNERTSDDALGAPLIFKKARLTGTGAVQANDNLGGVGFAAQDSTTAENNVASMVASATENHTGTNRGSQLKIQTTRIGSAAKVDTLTVGDQIISAVPVIAQQSLRMAAQILDLQDVPTTATVAALSATKAIVNFTGSTDTLVQGIDSSGLTKVLLIHNGSTGKITLSNQDSGALLANRFKFPLNRNLTILSNSSIELFYSTTENCWKLKSGSGSGSGGAPTVPTGNSRGAPYSITAAGGITSSTVDSVQYQFVQGSGGPVTLTATPQISPPTDIGTILFLQGRNDDQPLTLVNGNGISLGSDMTDLTLYADDIQQFIYDGTNWVLKRG